jgi:hypothetical protein
LNLDQKLLLIVFGSLGYGLAIVWLKGGVVKAKRITVLELHVDSGSGI